MTRYATIANQIDLSMYLGKLFLISAPSFPLKSKDSDVYLPYRVVKIEWKYMWYPINIRIFFLSGVLTGLFYISKLVYHFTWPPSKHEFQLLGVLISTYYCQVVMNHGVKWFLVVILICISVMNNNGDHFLICSFAIFVFSLLKCL